MSDVFIQAVFGLIKAVVFVYDVVAYIPYIITYRPQATLKRSSRIKVGQINLMRITMNCESSFALLIAR